MENPRRQLHDAVESGFCRGIEYFQRPQLGKPLGLVNGKGRDDHSVDPFAGLYAQRAVAYPESELRATYPFNAPEASPLMKSRCSAKNSTTTGKTLISVAAIRIP